VMGRTQHSAFSTRHSAIGIQPSAFSNQHSAKDIYPLKAAVLGRS